MVRNRKPSDKSFAVLMLLYNYKHKSFYGLEISKLTGTSAGTLYPILARMESREWIEGEWEEIDPIAEGRRPRKYYKITEKGIPVAREAEHDHKKLFKAIGMKI
jgi:DNA-binding PadR family transcriptional regulator